MKIAYIVFLQGKNAGIERSLFEKARALEALGDERMDVVMVGPDLIAEGGPRLRQVPIRRGQSAWWQFKKLFCRYRIIEKAIDLSSYDRILLRYPFADPSGPDFMARWPVWTEHHTLESEELVAGRDAATSWSIRQLKRLRLWLERRYCTAILARSRGLIGVTDEICTYEQLRVGGVAPTITVANGIDVEATPFTGFQSFDGRRLDLVVVSSGSAPWHGVDRVIEGMRRYRGDVRLRLHLVGGFSEVPLGRQAGSQGELIYHGTLRGEVLDRVMATANMALGAIAFSRNGMREGCSLKTREYMARGIPFLYGYDDPDLKPMEEDGAGFALRVPDVEEPLEFERVLDYVSGLAAVDPFATMSLRMRDYAGRHMDWRGKMARCLEFLTSSPEAGG